MLVKSSVRQLILTTQASYTTYVIGARIPRGSVTRALYWDTDDPYHYFRVAEGASFKDGDQRHSQLEAWARERFPMIETIEFGWSGPVVEPVDGIAFIGRNPGDPRNVYIATGDSGMGMTHGTIAGILITDLIMKRQCAWVPLYDPSRKTLRASLRFAMESINIVAEFVEGYLPGGDVSSTEEIAHGEGAIIQRGMRKLAVYRDEQGTPHARSAVCPHLGCIVSWNLLEKTWDCPCHGSSYDRYGRVIKGPANSDLEGVAEAVER